MARRTCWGVLMAVGLLCAIPVALGVKVASEDEVLLQKILVALKPSNATVWRSWNASRECSEWLGLTCDEQGRVTSINLKGKETSNPEAASNVPNTLDEFDLPLPALRGILPPSLGNVSQLQTLVLSGFAIAGGIPPQLARLTNLQVLNVSNNILEGPLPPELGQLSNLRILDLSFNQLTEGIPIPELISSLNGTIPESFGNLLNLEALGLSQNSFTGTPPASLRNLAKLKFLDLGYNQFTGPASTFLAPSSQLKDLDLSTNRFNGTFPDVISTLTNLETLQLYGNFYDGDLPASLGNLTNLRVLDLSGNAFTSVPDTIGNMAQLHYINLAVNALVGDIPAGIGLLPNLQRLELQQNGLSGPLPNFTSPEKLTYLNLQNNNFYGQATGGLPVALDTYVNLDTLYLDNNNFGGPFSVNLTSLKRLTALTCYGCNLIGELPPDIGALTNLQMLSLGGNRLNGEIPSTLGKLQNLIYLDLSGNQLSGAIPASLGNMTKLEDLWLNDNQLTGAIPRSLSRLQLSTLRLQQNFLTGTLSFLGGSLTGSLSELDLSNNSLSGQIPLQLGNFQSLYMLTLSFNDFESTLPITLGKLISLSTLQVRGCNLVGTLPLELAQLEGLTTLDLSYNAFTGSLSPDFFTKMTFLETLSISNTGISGKIPKLRQLTSLTNLDLSTNQFTSGLEQAFPGSLVSLNISNNHLRGNLTSFFSQLKKLSFVNMANNLLTGSVPLLQNASLVSLANNNIDGRGELDAYTRANRTLLLAGNSICSQVGVANQTACTTTAQLDSFAMAGVCYNTDSCLGTNVPNPYIFYAKQQCECSGYISISMTAVHSPFAAFTAEALQVFRKFWADKLKIDREQMFVTKATAAVDGTLRVQLRLFDVTSNAPSKALLAKLRRLWFADSRLVPLAIPKFGSIPPPSIATVDLLLPSPPPPLQVVVTTQAQSDNSIKGWQIAVIAVGAFLLFTIIALLLILVFRKKEQMDRHSSFTIRLQEHMVRPIRLAEIRAATDNFSDKALLGAGGYGMVYKGVAPSGDLWAVKRAKSVSRTSLQDFENEVDIISKMAHTNIVRLLGYCDERNEQIFVYELMAGGTLKGILQHNPDKLATNPLTFAQRVDIAIGSAEGLRYLHNFAKPTIIHRDIKSENILLDEDLKAKIADFGLLKDKTGADTDLINTRVAGTPGYIDPEYYTSFQVTPKSDVYSFGVVLWELITGLGALIKHPSSEDPDEPTITALANWVQPYLHDIKQLVDPRLNGEFDLEAMELLVHLATNCIERCARYRPNMNEVARRLGKIKNVIDGVAEETEGSLDHIRSSSSLSSSVSLQVPSSVWGSLTASQSFFVPPVSGEVNRGR